MAAEAQTEVGDVSVRWRPHLGELEVKLGLPEGGERLPKLRIRFAHGAELGLSFGQRRLRFKQVRLGLEQSRVRNLL